MQITLSYNFQPLHEGNATAPSGESRTKFYISPIQAKIDTGVFIHFEKPSAAAVTLIELLQSIVIYSTPAFTSDISVCNWHRDVPQLTINLVVVDSIDSVGVYSLSLKLTRGNFSQINVATYRNEPIKPS